MILVDSSVWIDFWRNRVYTDSLAGLIDDQLVLTHDLVIAELAVGNLGPARVRVEILAGLDVLPRATVAELKEVLTLIHVEHLDRRGLGGIDVHLLASARLASASLWTADKTLASAAEALGLRYPG